jgi:hypothetical protein
MHSALGLTSDEDSEETEEMLEADFIIADEFTMSDMRLSYIFFTISGRGPAWCWWGMWTSSPV